MSAAESALRLTPHHARDGNDHATSQLSNTVQLGLIGLGKMGGNIAERLRRDGHRVVGYDRNPDSPPRRRVGAELVTALPAPRVIWVMAPSVNPPGGQSRRQLSLQGDVRDVEDFPGLVYRVGEIGHERGKLARSWAARSS
jgi:hypothetical protein